MVCMFVFWFSRLGVLLLKVGWLVCLFVLLWVLDWIWFWWFAVVNYDLGFGLLCVWLIVVFLCVSLLVLCWMSLLDFVFGVLVTGCLHVDWFFVGLFRWWLLVYWSFWFVLLLLTWLRFDCLLWLLVGILFDFVGFIVCWFGWLVWWFVVCIGVLVIGLFADFVGLVLGLYL